MATKRLTFEDFTQNPQAQTVNDVLNQDTYTRGYQSVMYPYMQQIEKSNKAYDKEIANSDMRALARGMQRSSYNIATQANLGKEKVNAANEIANTGIAAFQNWMNQQEQQEKENERWEREFAANREDADWSKQFQTEQFNYSKERDLTADEQWEKEYNEKLRQFNENMAFQKERANVSDAQWEKEYNEKLRQFNEQMAENKRQFDLNYNENVRQFNAQYALQSAAANGSGGGGKSTGNNGAYNPPKPNNEEGITEEDEERSDLYTRLKRESSARADTAAWRIK